MGTSDQVDGSSAGERKAEQEGRESLPYPLTMQQLNTGEYCAEIPALPGCRSVGESMEAALANVLKAGEAWIAEASRRGEEIPASSTGQAVAWAILPLSQRMFVSYLTRARRRGVDLPDLLMEALDSYGARI